MSSEPDKNFLQFIEERFFEEFNQCFNSQSNTFCIFHVLDNLRLENWNIYFACLDFRIFNWPKRIQTPHNLFLDLGADKTFTTCWSGCRAQLWVHKPLLVICQLFPKAIPEENWSFLLQNQWPSFLGSHWCSGTAQVGRTCKDVS